MMIGYLAAFVSSSCTKDVLCDCLALKYLAFIIQGRQQWPPNSADVRRHDRPNRPPGNRYDPRNQPDYIPMTTNGGHPLDQPIAGEDQLLMGDMRETQDPRILKDPSLPPDFDVPYSSKELQMHADEQLRERDRMRSRERVDDRDDIRRSDPSRHRY